MSKDKYDRQTRLWGEGQVLISKCSVLCFNSDAAIAEILKNLILSGIGSVCVTDDSVIKDNDLLSNFFVTEKDVGKKRAEVLLKNLLELNSDVKGKAVLQNPNEYISNKNNLNEILSYDIYITADLSEEFYRNIYRLTKTHNKRLISVSNNGLYGFMRIYENFHANMKLRLMESPVSDFRLNEPWKELADFAAEFQLEKLSEIDRSRVPYFALLIKGLKVFEQKFGKRNPRSFQEKEEFKQILSSFSQPNDELNGNVKEAVSHYYYCNADAGELLLEKINDVFLAVQSHPPNFFLSASNFFMKLFFFFVLALKKFAEKNGGFPLCGNIPDMISSTENYIKLKKIYMQKAEKDHGEMRDIVLDLVKSAEGMEEGERGHLVELITSKSEDTVDIIDILNKNWPQITLFEYPEYEEEETGKNLDRENFDDEHKKSNFIIYILFRASQIFGEKNKRFPGENIKDFESDVNELKSISSVLLQKITPPPFENALSYLSNDIIHEFCRMGHSLLPPVVSFFGSVASQEIIKLITYQFKTFNNTLIYDGVNVVLSDFKI